MEAIVKILKGLIKLIIRLAIVYAVFLALAWALLGVPPMEGWTVTKSRISSATSFMTGASSDVSKTAGDMKRVGSRHLQDAKDRFNGKDPYEEFNKSLSNPAAQ